MPKPGSAAATVPVPRPSKDDIEGVMQVTDGSATIDPNMLTLDASRSSALASMVKPEVKLKAILEIARNLSTELKIDAVAPQDPRLADGAVPAGRAALPDPGRSGNQAAGPQGVQVSPEPASLVLATQRSRRTRSR